MTYLSRRNFLFAASISLLSACANGVGSAGGAKIDARSDSALAFLYDSVPGSQDLADKASGILIMPLISEAGFGVGASYGRGALRVDGATVDYYAATSASFGLQFGAQQFSHALFFMTDQALEEFRNSPGWTVGADAKYVVKSDAGIIGTDTTTLLSPVIAIVFGQAGLIGGATIEGNKYSRIIP